MKIPNRISLYFSILLKSSLVLLIFSDSLQAATIEAKVLNQLRAAKKAQVIVTLHDPVSAYLETQKKKHGFRGSVSDKQHQALIAQAQTAVLSTSHLRSANHFKLKRQYSYIPALAGTLTAQALAILQNHPQVASIQLDKQHKFSLAESIPHIQADVVHAMSYTGKGITVALLDTGIDTDHPDLADSIVAQHCFSQASCPPFYTNESDSAEDDIYGGGHGTHVAGIITSPRGVAPDAGIVAIKVFSNMSIFSVSLDSDILAALDWIRAHLSTQPVHIISLSLGGGAFSNVCDDENPAYASIFKQLRAKDITIFVAAGNEGSKNEIAAPACLNDTIAVGATTISNNMADFSNSNNLVDILAPGIGITSSLIGGGDITKAGTSMATPMAAGVAALMLQANPTLTPLIIETIMENTGVTVTDAGNGLTFPRIDALAAVSTAQNFDLEGVAFDFATQGYKIDETSSVVTIEVSRLGSDDGRVSVDYVTADGTATVGNDYIATSGTLIWENGDTSNKSLVVNILDNNEPDTDEKAFLVSLHNPTGNFIGNKNTRHQAIVTILDNEAVGSLELTGISEQTFIDDFFVFGIRHGVEENAGTITIEVARLGGNKGEVSIDYATVDSNTATAGDDYIAIQGTLTWSDGDMDNQKLSIKILEDAVFEGKETFSLVLSNPTNGATLGENSHTTIVIADNEYGMGITDGSFELGKANLPHPVWSGGMSISQSPILSNPEMAHTGNHFLSLGGIAHPIATLAVQRFIIPTNASALNFWLKIRQVDGTDNDFMVVLIDGNEHFFATAAANSDFFYSDYQLVAIDDIHAYADGDVHDVIFYSEVFGSDTSTTHFLIDEVALVTPPSKCFPNITPIPVAPQLEVTIDDHHAQATWTTVAEAQGYTFSYAPYSDPISDVTVNHIEVLDLGAQTTIAGDLASGTALYVAVQAYNCSGTSLYSNLGVVVIP
jgi:hypothetical protein